MILMPYKVKVLSLQVLLVLAILVVTTHIFKTQHFMLIFLLTSIPVLLVAMKPSVLMVLMIATSASGLVFPGLPSALNVQNLIMVYFCILVIAGYIVIGKRKTVRPIGLTHMFLIFFAIVIAMTMYKRGFGIRLFGGNLWGGMHYVKILIVIFTCFLSLYISLTDRQITISLIAMICMGFLPAVAQVLFWLSNGKLYQQYWIIEASGAIGMASGLYSGDMTRYTQMGALGVKIYEAGFSFFSLRKTLQIIACIGMLLVGLMFIAFSGFRSRLLGVGLSLIIFLWLTRKEHRLMLLISVAGVVLVISSLYYISSELPLGIQRIVSFLPGIQVDPIVYESIIGSDSGRKEIWRIAATHLGEYLIIGRGLAFDQSITMSQTLRAYWPSYAYAIHAYHQGFFSLQLDFGLFGTLSCIGFMFCSVKELLKRRSCFSCDDFVGRVYHVFISSYIAGVILFFAVYGDVGGVIDMIFNYTWLELMSRMRKKTS